MKSSFQTILIIVFAAAFVVAVVVFSGVFSSGNSSKTSTTPSGQVALWGILPREQVRPFLDAFNGSGKGYTINYTEHDPSTFAQELIVALANGVQPDLVMVTSEIFSQFKDKMALIPFQAYSERTFRDTNIDGAQIFLQKDGIVAYPLLVDPLVVYYNKDILASERFILPPQTWDDLVQSVPLFTKRAKDGSLTQSAIALGTTNNVDHFRDILSALFLQTGTPIIKYDTTLNKNTASLVTGVSSDPSAPLPSEQALSFYTTFSDPTVGSYSWNRSLPSSLDVFLSGKSAFYIGRASELFSIQQQNPNLNFDVEELFQPTGALRHITYGSFIGIGALRSGLNQIAGYAALRELTTSSAIDSFAKAVSLPPARRDLLLVQQDNPYVSVFFKSTLGAYSWPDPDPQTTQSIFSGMITDVTSGKKNVITALYDANKDLQSAIR